MNEVLESLRWKKFPVMGTGFVTLVDAMGGDDSVVQAARVSYGLDARCVDDLSEKALEKIEANLPSGTYRCVIGNREHPDWTYVNNLFMQEHAKIKAKDDRTLLRYLMRQRHTTPFEMAEIKLLIRVPMDCWRQWIRHRTANVNEYSTRYMPAIDDRAETLPGEWRIQSVTNKQGSGGSLDSEFPNGLHLWPIDEDAERGTCDLCLAYMFDDQKPEYDANWRTWALCRKVGDDEEIVFVFYDRSRAECTPGLYLSLREKESHESVTALYQERLDFGVAREQARKDLPLSTFTEAYWKCDLHNVLHFLALRMDPHAQKEIRDCANIIGHEIIKPLFPVAWAAFEDYRLNAMTLTALDIQVIGNLVREADNAAYESFVHRQPTLASDTHLPPYTLEMFTKHHGIAEWNMQSCRERDECLEKLKRLGIVGTA